LPQAARRAADAFQDRNALDLLLHEHARHARHADAAENEHHQTDQAQIVLRPHQVLPHAIGGGPVPAAANEFICRRCQQIRFGLDGACTCQKQEHLPRHTTAEPEQPRSGHVGIIDQHARPDAERADAAPRLLLDHTANLERLRADEDAVAHPELELREQLRPDQRATVSHQLVRVGP